MMITSSQWDQTICCQKEFYTPAMQSLLEDIDAKMQTPWKVLKDDPTSTVVVLKIDEQYLVVKRSNTKNWGHALRRIFARSRARKNWVNANKLLKIGVRTFHPVAFIEKRWGPFKGRSYFICTYIQGIDALHYFAHGAKIQPQWENVAKGIIGVLERLAQHKISHRDLNLSNIILVNDDPWLIDLDGMRQYHFGLWARRGAQYDRMRFMRNWQHAPNVLPETISFFQTVFSTLDERVQK